MLRKTAAVLAAALVHLWNQTATVSDCAPGTSVFTIQAAYLTPAEVVPGAPVTLHLEWDVPHDTVITAGKATYDVSINGLPFPSSTEDVCSQFPCPLEPGSYVNETVSTWPTGISGKVDSIMRWYDEAGALLLCLETVARF